MTLYHHLVEIGAGDSHSSAGLVAARRGEAERVTLFEPNTILYADLKRAAVSVANVTVHDCAVADYAGHAGLFHFGYASYLDGAPSFLATSVEPEGIAFWAPLKRTVAVGSMTALDARRDIDYLVLTIGGGELPILRAMKSRPRRIDTKHYLHNAAQCQCAHEVQSWLRGMGYAGRLVESNLHSTFQSVVWSRDA